jgi:hypothetical protein
MPCFGPCLNYALFAVKNIPCLTLFNNKYPLQRDIFCTKPGGLLEIGWPKGCCIVTMFLVLLCVSSLRSSYCSYSVLKHCAHIRCTHIVCTYSIRSAHVYYCYSPSSMHSSLCSSYMYSYYLAVLYRAKALVLSRPIHTRTTCSTYSHIVSLRSHMLICVLFQDSCKCVA